MPYVSSQLEDEKKKKELGSFNITNDSTTSFNQSQNNTQSTTPKPVNRSGSWVNLQSYLDANKENAQDMSSKIAGNIETKAQSANDSLTNIKAPEVIKEKTQTDLDNEYYSNQNAKKEDYQKFKSTGGYEGPKTINEIENWDSINNDAKKAQTLVDNSKSEEGRRNLLQETYSRPQYTSGQKNLDNLLLQNDATAKSKFEDLQSKWSGISNLLGTKENEINSAIGTNLNNAYKNKTLVPQAESAARNSIINPIQSRVNEYNASKDSLIGSVSEDLKDNILNESTLSRLGLGEGQNVFNLDLQSYLNPNTTLAGLDNLANSEERARYLALANLIDDPTMTQITNNGKELNPISFNKDQFLKDVSAKQAEYDKNYGSDVLDLGGRYIPNPGGDYKMSDIITKATPAQIQQLINAFNSMSFDDQMRNEIDGGVSNLEKILNDWKNSYDVNKKIQKG